MSYTQQEALHDWQSEVEKAINERDGEKLYKLAQLADDEEVADDLLRLVRKWDGEDWSYDSSINN